MAFNPATKRTLLATVPGTLPGVSFNVVLDRGGCTCGNRADCEGAVCKAKGKELVEFYDTRYPHTPFGQFVSRYYLSSIASCYGGLDLMGYEPSWKVSAAGMVMALAALKAVAQ